MIEKITFMHIVDNKYVVFEKEDKNTIVCSIDLVPSVYKAGHVIKVIIHSEDNIEFLGIDTKEMEFRTESIIQKKNALRNRLRRK